MTFYFVGDMHLERLHDIANGHFTESQALEAQLYSLREVLRRADSKGVEDVVQGGDITHTPFPDQSTLEALADVLRDYPHITFHVSIGNHDFYKTNKTSTNLLKWLGKVGLVNVKVYTVPTMVKMKDGQRVWMSPHPFVKKPIRKVDWCVGHFTWRGAKYDTGKKSTEGSKPPKGKWLLGHHHNHQSQRRYVYPGALTQVAWVEDDIRGFLVVEPEEWRFEALDPVYTLARTTVKSEAEVKKLDPTKLWSVIPEEGVDLPYDLLEKYDHVIRKELPKSSSKIKDSEEVYYNAEFDLVPAMKDWLSKNSQLNSRQTKSALKIVRNFERKIKV